MLMPADDEEGYEVALSQMSMSRALATHAYRNVLKEKALGTYQEAKTHGDIIAQAQESVLSRKLTMGREAVCQSARHRRNNASRKYVETKAELDHWDLNQRDDLASEPGPPDEPEVKQAPPSPERTSFLPDIGLGKRRIDPLHSAARPPSLTPLKIPAPTSTRSTANSPVLAIFSRWRHYDEQVAEGDKVFMDLTAIRQERRLKPLSGPTPCPVSPACKSPAPNRQPLPIALSCQLPSCPLPGTKLPSPLGKSDHADKAKKTLGWRQIEEEMQQVERALEKIRSQSMSRRPESPFTEANEPATQGTCQVLGGHKSSPLPRIAQADALGASSTLKARGAHRRAASSLALVIPPDKPEAVGRSAMLGGTALQDRMCWSSLGLTQLSGSHAAVHCR